MKRDKVVLTCILFALLAVYAQVVTFGFVNYDDPQYVANNPFVNAGLSLNGLKWAFTSYHTGATWHPLTWVSHMLDSHLFGTWPGGHHATSLLFHGINTVLLYFVFYRMTGEAGACLFVAALFALHPLHVESVAWVAERKDVLSAFFFLLTLLSYQWYSIRPAVSRYIVTIFFFVLGLMSKPMLVTVPFVLLLLDWWPLYRMRPLVVGNYVMTAESDYCTNNCDRVSLYRLFAEKIPFFLISAVFGLIAVYAQREGGALVSVGVVSVADRIGSMFIRFAWYAWKMLWPTNLAFYYPNSSGISVTGFLASTVFAAGMSVWSFRQVRQSPYILVGWLWFVVTLLPVIGLVAVGMQDTADRYSYIPSIGFTVMFVWHIRHLGKKYQFVRRILPLAAVVAVALFSVFTWCQVGVWKNSFELSGNALKVTKENYVAHVIMGDALDDQGKADAAIMNYREALRIMPTYEAAHNSLGTVLAKQGNIAEAMKSFSKAVSLNPQYADGYANMGLCMISTGNFADALKFFQEVKRINPEYPGISGYIQQASRETGTQEGFR